LAWVAAGRQAIPDHFGGPAVWQVRQVSRAGTIGGAKARHRRPRSGEMQHHAGPCALQSLRRQRVPNTHRGTLLQQVVYVPMQKFAPAQVSPYPRANPATSTRAAAIKVQSGRELKSPQPPHGDFLRFGQQDVQDIRPRGRRQFQRGRGGNGKTQITDWRRNYCCAEVSFIEHEFQPATPPAISRTACPSGPA